MYKYIVSFNTYMYGTINGVGWGFQTSSSLNYIHMNLLLQIFKNLLCIKKMGKVEIRVRISYDMILKLLLLKYVHPMRGKPSRP